MIRVCAYCRRQKTRPPWNNNNKIYFLCRDCEGELVKKRSLILYKTEVIKATTITTHEIVVLGSVTLCLLRQP